MFPSGPTENLHASIRITRLRIPIGFGPNPVFADIASLDLKGDASVQGLDLRACRILDKRCGGG